MTGAVVGLVVLVGVTTFLAAAETVLVRLPLVRALRMAEEGAARADVLLDQLEHRSRALGAVLVATVLVRSVAAVLAAEAGRRAAGPPGLVAGLVVVVVAMIVLGEVAPRSWTLRHLERAGLRLARPLRVLVTVLDPLARLLVQGGRLAVRTRRDSAGPFPSDHPGAEEESERDDDPLDEEERSMVSSVLALSDTVAREVMTPRPDVVCVDRDDELRGVVDALLSSGYSRLPVVTGTFDRVVGTVYAKDVLELLAHRPAHRDWSGLVREATFVPETKQVDELLAELRESSVHQAVVVDEYGSVVGLVTIEDVLEEIVGEIVDEHDVEEQLVTVLDDTSLRIDARLSVDDLNALLDADLPDDEWDTVGGLVFGMLGHVPDEGEQVTLDGVRFTAERVQGRRVAQVLVARAQEAGR